MLVLPGRVLLFWSIIIYRRSIIIYLDRHVIFPSYIPYERLIILDERSILITSRSIIIYHQSICNYLTRHVNFSFVYTLYMVDHTWAIYAFFQWSCYLFSIPYGKWTVDRNLPCPQRWHFSPKSWTISRMLPKHIDRPTRISYFCSQVVLTRFFSKYLGCKL